MTKNLVLSTLIQPIFVIRLELVLSNDKLEICSITLTDC
jgi:hypothetical protein